MLFVSRMGCHLSHQRMRLVDHCLGAVLLYHTAQLWLFKLSYLPRERLVTSPSLAWQLIIPY